MTAGDGRSGGGTGGGMRGGAPGGDLSGCSNCALIIRAPLADSGCNNGNEGDLLANRWVKSSAVFLR